MKRGVVLNCHCNNYVIHVFCFGFYDRLPKTILLEFLKDARKLIIHT